MRVDAGHRLALQPLGPAIAPEARVRRLDRVRDPALRAPAGSGSRRGGSCRPPARIRVWSAPRRCEPEPAPTEVRLQGFPGETTYRRAAHRVRPAAAPRRVAHARREPSGGVVARRDALARARPRPGRRVPRGRVGTGRDDRPCAACGGRRVWLRTVALEVLEAYHRPPLDRPRELSAYVEIVIDELRAADAAAARAARAAVSPGDGPRAVAGAADRHDGRARVVPGARARRAGVVRRRPRARAGGARRAPAPLPLPQLPRRAARRA